jgi:hypothetical protein
VNAYTQHIQPGQDVLDANTPWNPLDFGVEISTRKEVRGFLDAIPEPPSVTEARYEIIRAYESGAMGAVEALNALEAYGCLRDPDDLMRPFVAGYYALAGVPTETSPETPDVAPEPAKTVRVTSHAYRGLDALAEARSGRTA